VDANHGLEEQPVGHVARSVAQAAHLLRSDEHRADLGLTVFGYERQDQVFLAGLECLAGGGDHGTVK
jgi:hypothetical protein